MLARQIRVGRERRRNQQQAGNQQPTSQLHEHTPRYVVMLPGEGMRAYERRDVRQVYNLTAS
jgi:hypothetical protein